MVKGVILSLILLSTSPVGGEVFLQCLPETLQKFNLTAANFSELKYTVYPLVNPSIIQSKNLGTVSSSCLFPIHLIGEITNRDGEQMERLLKAKKDPLISVSVNSSGGDVNAAIKIGRLLLSHEANVSVKDGDLCASSCVLVLAGAVRKDIEGTVAIHRIQFADHRVAASLNQEQYRKIYEQGMDEIKSYLKEMGIRPDLADEMMRYSSDEAHVLSLPEIKYYGLDQVNPYYYEQGKSKVIADCGQEWWDTWQILRRVADEKCGALPELPKDPTLEDRLQWPTRVDSYMKCIDGILGPLRKMCK